jgi:hypothetical protein
MIRTRSITIAHRSTPFASGWPGRGPPRAFTPVATRRGAGLRCAGSGAGPPRRNHRSALTTGSPVPRTTPREAPAPQTKGLLVATPTGPPTPPRRIVRRRIAHARDGPQRPPLARGDADCALPRCGNLLRACATPIDGARTELSPMAIAPAIGAPWRDPSDRHRDRRRWAPTGPPPELGAAALAIDHDCVRGRRINHRRRFDLRRLSFHPQYSEHNLIHYSKLRRGHRTRQHENFATLSQTARQFLP